MWFLYLDGVKASVSPGSKVEYIKGCEIIR